MKKSNLSRLKRYKVEDPIYGYDLQIYLGSQENIYNYLKKLKVPEEFAKQITEADAVFLNSKETELDYEIIGLTQKSVSNLTHEVIHCAFFVLTDVGIPIDLKTDEAFAYYCETLLDLILETKILK